MKICYLNHDLKNTTGCGRFCLALIKEVKNILPSTEITVLTSEYSSNELEKPIIKTGVLGVALSILKIRKIFKNYDVIHALDGWPYGVIAAIASLGLKKKVIITAIGSGAVAPLYSNWKKPIINWAYKKANVLTAISSNTKKEILKILPYLKINIINHGVDTNNFQIINDKLQIPISPRILDGKTIGTNSNIQNLKPYILSVGALKPRKGFEYSLKAFAKIANKFPELKYVIFGKDNSENKKEYNRLNKVAIDLNIRERVVFLSERLTDEALISLYKNAELFILLPQDDNKDIEGFGLVFLEAAACGLPVVSTKDSSAEDAVLDSKNGILVSSKDTAAAAEAVSKILTDKNLHENFSRESLEFAKKMSWHKTASEYIKFY